MTQFTKSPNPPITKWLRPRLHKLLVQLPYLPRALRLVFAAARRWTLLWAALLLIQGLLPVATVYLTRPLVDSLVAAIRAGGDWREPLLLIALMAGVLVLGEALRSLTGWVRTAQSELVHDHITSLIHRKSLAVDLAFYESPDYYDHLHRARAEAVHRPLALLESLGSILQNGVTLAAMAAILAPFGWWVPLALVASTLPALFVVLRFAERQHDWRTRKTPDERRAWYYDWVLTAGQTAPEVRLFALGDHFRAAYSKVRDRLRRERVSLARDQSVAELSAGIAALGVSAAALAWMAWKTVRGMVGLGDLALFYQAFNQGLRLARGLLDQVGQLYANLLFLGNLFEFLALEPQIVDPKDPQPPVLEREIRFRDVTFRYPGSDRPALNGFVLSIPVGQIAAIVGANGAGKSTVIKLLCRFYEPDAGSIELDAANLQRFSLDQLRRMITVLFQEPVHYNATVAENIGLGDLGATGIRAAAEAAGAGEIVSRLPMGYDHLLGKWFAGGAELSVGEWQRIALARAFLREAPILVLDEPTSAMDPWAEADWLKRFRKLAAGRTAILITHRFTTARYADRIYVMEDGRIVESGTHDELLALNARYAQGWGLDINEAY